MADRSPDLSSASLHFSHRASLAEEYFRPSGRVNCAEAWCVGLPLDGREMQTVRKRKLPKLWSHIASGLIWRAKARDYSPVVVFLCEECELEGL